MEGPSSPPSYSHLLYLNDAERAHYLSSSSLSKARPESISFFSMTSSRYSTESDRSTFSEISGPSSSQSSVQSATISMPKYADDHYPLITSLDPLSTITLGQSSSAHAAAFCAKQMACTHNTIIRALNSSYNHAIVIRPATQQCRDFLKFNQILLSTLRSQQSVEEEFLFPAFEKLLKKPGIMEENILGHASFMKEVDRFQDHVFNPATIESFDCAYFRRAINSFAPRLIRHLHDEIPSILRMHAADSKEVRKIWAKAQKLAAERFDPYETGPFILGCQDKSFLLEGEIFDFPDVPWLLETLVRKWYAKKHTGVWGFLPSDLHGTRRMLLM